MSQETVFAHALTTPQRVKDLLGITTNQFDPIIARLVNSVTDYIERECNRRFLETTYTHDVYSIYGNKQKYLALRQSPVKSLSALEYRAGTPDTPSWTAFITNQYELIDPTPIPGNETVLQYPTGVVRVYGVMPRIFSNSIRATYIAGYKIDFKNYGDFTKHELPADLTATAENLVIRKFKRRDHAGKSSESLEGSSISWRNDIDQEDKDVINHHKRQPYIF